MPDSTWSPIFAMAQISGARLDLFRWCGKWKGLSTLPTAGLQNIPEHLYEAAKLDGAGPLQTFFRITLPLLTPALVPATILSAITTFQMFNTAYLITQGGPIVSALKPGATEFVMVYMYNRILGAGIANPHYGVVAHNGR